VPVVSRAVSGAGGNRGFLSVSAPSLAPWASINANLPRKNMSLELDSEGSMKLLTKDRMTGESMTVFNLQSDALRRWITEWEIQEKLWSGWFSQKAPEEREEIKRAISKVSEEVEAQLVDLAEKISVADANRLRKQVDALNDAMLQGDGNLTELRAMMRALQAKSKEVAMKSTGHPHWEEWQRWHNVSAAKKQCLKGRRGDSDDMTHTPWVLKFLLGMALRKWFR